MFYNSNRDFITEVDGNLWYHKLNKRKTTKNKIKWIG